VHELGVRFQRSRCLQKSIRPNDSAGRPAPAKQAAVLNALSARITLLDADGVIVVVNEAWRSFAADQARRLIGGRHRKLSGNSSERHGTSYRGPLTVMSAANNRGSEGHRHNEAHQRLFRKRPARSADCITDVSTESRKKTTLCGIKTALLTNASI
jgi:hypothetical protein